MVVVLCVGGACASRSWRGLDPQLGNTPVQAAVQGSVGLAMGYSHEQQK